MTIINYRKGGIAMKIVISSNGKTNESLLDMRFGRCEYFQIHDTETGNVKIPVPLIQPRTFCLIKE